MSITITAELGSYNGLIGSSLALFESTCCSLVVIENIADRRESTKSTRISTDAID